MEQLRAKDIPFSYRPDANRSEIMQALADGADGLVLRSKTIADRELLSHATNLKFIARGGAGLDNIDEVAATEAGILCINSGNANSDAVGEHALGMLLSLLRNIHTADAQVRKGIWLREANRGLELNGRTVGIVGYGNTGSAFARMLSGFGVNILAYDKYKKNYGNDFVKESNMEEIFQNAEIVSFHVPLDGHTNLMVNSQYLQQFVRKIFLLNLSRGGILNTIDVVNALKNNRILGFAADVLEHEDPASMGVSEHLWFDELIGMHNVVLTPHIGGWTKESYEKISGALANQILKLKY